MVRLKSRYILFEVLYPEQLNLSQSLPSNNSSSNPASNSSHVPLPILTCIQLRQPPINLDTRTLLSAIRLSISTNFGTQAGGAGTLCSASSGSASLALKYFSQRTSTGILRVARDHFRTAWAALAYLTEVGGRKVVVRVVRVSGTIKKCEQAAIARDQQVIRLVTGGMEEMKERENGKGDFGIGGLVVDSSEDEMD